RVRKLRRRAHMVLPQQTVTANPQRAARDLHRIDLVLLDVVVDRAAIDIHDLRRSSHAYNLYVFTTTRTPYFVPKHQRRLRHIHTLPTGSDFENHFKPFARSKLPVAALPVAHSNTLSGSVV